MRSWAAEWSASMLTHSPTRLLVHLRSACRISGDETGECALWGPACFTKSRLLWHTCACVHACVCLWLLVCGHIHEQVRGPLPVSFLDHHQPWPLEIVWDLPGGMDRLACLWVPGPCLSLSPQPGYYKLKLPHSAFLHKFWGSDSHPLSYTARVL